MLTRFEVSGFKNLEDVVVELGPFTCVAGPNAVGKSNLFDAMELLSLLSQHSFLEAIAMVRPTAQQRPDIRTVFSRAVIDGERNLSLAAEMILPRSAEDDFGQVVEPSRTFVRYELEIAVRRDDSTPGGLGLHLAHEKLAPRTSAATTALRFPGGKGYQDSVTGGRRNPYLEWKDSGNHPVVSVRAESGAGRPREVAADGAPRSVLSAVASAEYPTVLVTRAEMMSWRFVALEPSAMRAADDLMERRGVTAAGAHVPAALHRQELAAGGDGRVLQRVQDSVGSLVDIRSLRVQEDPVRQTLEIRAQVGDAPELPARSLSDGTLRFLTLAAMSASDEYLGMVCMEEPENGVHPAKITAMHALLHELAQRRPDSLRQVVVNTHSPYFVQCTDDQEILCAIGRTMPDGHGGFSRGVDFRPLPGTWRTEERGDRGGSRPVSRGELAAYLENPARWAADA